ncbi:MAG TPA: HAD-IA family hydrolase [Gaiellaceae bacterium]|nr:HAD-IA family hydrolase [Gaiellaceae bacterium]
MTRAVLFDFDGVVVDTESPTYQSWRDIYAEQGVDLPLEAYLPAVGTGSSTSATDGGFDAVIHLEGLIGRPVDRRSIVDRRARRKRELCDAAPLLPGVDRCLEDAAGMGARTAIVTRNRREWVDHHCARVGLAHAWDAIVCAEETPTMDKSELYRTALAVLAVAPGDAVAIEDSPAGVAAAKRAGVYCVAVPNAITSGADFAGADLVLASLDDLQLAAVFEGIQRTGS